MTLTNPLKAVLRFIDSICTPKWTSTNIKGCIAIHKPAGISIPKNVLKACFAKNKDGAGLAYVKDGKLVVNKGFFSDKAAIRAIREHEEKEMIIHFRVASPGMVIDKANCHPFKITSKQGGNWSFAVIHNGRLPWKNTALKSDTACFTDDFLKQILSRDPWFFDQEYGIMLMEDFIGINNKLVIMRLNEDTQETDVYILNENQGTQAYGCWMSNYSYIPSWQHGGFAGRSREDWDDDTFFGSHIARGNNVHQDVEDDDDDDSLDSNVFGSYYLCPITRQWAVIGSPEHKVMLEAKAKAAGGEAGKGKDNVIDITTGQDQDEKASAAMAQDADETEDWSGISDRMDYFTPDERRQMRAICAPYLKAQGIDLKGVGTADVVELAIDDLRYYMPELKSMEDEPIRRWVLKDGEEAFDKITEGLKTGTMTGNPN